MEKVGQAIYTAMRDDSEATNGIRALLGNTTTSPYNVFHAQFPDEFDFSASGGAKGLITYHFVSASYDTDMGTAAVKTFQAVYNVSAYARALSTVESVHRRVKLRLDRMRNVTVPTSQAWIHQIKLESEGPNLFDDAFQVWRRTAIYRAWCRDDNVNG